MTRPGQGPMCLALMLLIEGLPERIAWRIIPGLGYVANNHGDRFSPQKIGQRGTPSKWPIYMAYKWG